MFNCRAVDHEVKHCFFYIGVQIYSSVVSIYCDFKEYTIWVASVKIIIIIDNDKQQIAEHLWMLSV